MMRPNDKKILNCLRNSARSSTTDLAQITNIPVSTVHDIVKRLENKYIKRYTSLYDFKKIGHPIHVYFLLKVRNSILLLETLANIPQVNNVYLVGNNFDCCCDAYFSDMKAYFKFIETIEIHGVKESVIVHISSSIVKESFKT